MQIEKTTYGPWQNAYRCVIGEQELIVVADIGPRILSLRLAGGKNILFNDLAGNMARGDWKIWGGHRLWISPETESTYLPDNALCEVAITQETEDDRTLDILTVSAPAGPGGLRRTIEIAEQPELGAFEIRNRVENMGPMLAHGAIWALTCVEPEGRVVVPWGGGAPAWRTQMVRYWRHWAGSESNVESSQWRPRNEYFLVEPTGEVGKVGLYTDHEFMAFLRSDCTFIKSVEFVDWPADATYPDGGCNIEIYTCNFFIELETLAAMHTFMPGERYEHRELWKLTPKTFEPEQWAEIEEELA